MRGSSCSCSTPFGIRGSRISTRLCRRSRQEEPLLNAFRHQRFPHDPESPWGRGHRYCSTPFGIRGSRISERAAHHSADAELLNAFRHQRFPHIPHPRCSWLKCRLLNAFRHQRFPHTQEALGYPYVCYIYCSTPFGIRGSRICKVMNVPCPSTLLNAFRHQRFPHRLGSARRRWPRRCPAQRLSASEVPALQRTDARRRRRGSALLNAFRHQRFPHFRHRVIMPVSQPFCSTPFGIRGSRMSTSGVSLATRRC